MSDYPSRAAAIRHMMRRLDEFTRGLGLDEAATREIIEQIAVEMQDHSDEECLDAAKRPARA